MSTSGSVTESLFFTADHLTIEDTGSINGTMTFSFDSVCESSGHIKLSLVSGTGDFLGMASDSKLFLLYEIQADTLYIGLDVYEYPTRANIGPYTRM